MENFINEESRKWVRNNLKKLNKRYKFIDNYNVGIKIFDDFFEQNSELRKESVKFIHGANGTLIDISILFSICISCIACSLYKDHEERSIFPKSWISLEEKPDPNFIFSCLFSQLFQMISSSVKLIENGFNYSARILSRSAIEMSWQILILSYFREDLKVYVAADENGGANHVWWKLFGKGKMLKKISQIERELLLPDNVHSSLMEYRKETYSALSESVHHGSLEVMLSSFNWAFDENNNIPDSDEAQGKWSALGGVSTFSVEILNGINYSLSYFLRMFFVVVEYFHGIDLEGYSDTYWKIALVAKDCGEDLLAEYDKTLT